MRKGTAFGMTYSEDGM